MYDPKQPLSANVCQRCTTSPALRDTILAISASQFVERFWPAFQLQQGSHFYKDRVLKHYSSLDADSTQPTQIIRHMLLVSDVLQSPPLAWSETLRNIRNPIHSQRADVASDDPLVALNWCLARLGESFASLSFLNVADSFG